MSELDDRLVEGRATVTTMDPPEDLWARAIERSNNNGDAAILDLTTARHRRRTSLWLAVAAVTVLLALVGALALLDDHQTVDTTPVTEGPVVPEPPNDGLTILAKGEDVELVGDVTSGLRNQTLNIDAHQQAGEATGEIRFDDNVIRVECAENIGGRVVLGGTATAGSYLEVGDLYALLIREGDPDSVALIPNEIPVWASSTGAYWGGYQADSCDDFLETIPPYGPPADLFVEVEDGHDIETG